MHEDDPFDPERFRLTPEQQAAIGATNKPKSRRRQQGKFVQVPELWREQLVSIDAHAATYRVALHLLYEAWRADSRYVKLTNGALAKLRVSRFSKARALAQLRKAGLIAVEQRPGSNPIVTVRFREG
jgi:hypothetical protein